MKEIVYDVDRPHRLGRCVVVSDQVSPRARNPAPLPVMVASVFSRSRVLRASRSSRVTISTSPGSAWRSGTAALAPATRPRRTRSGCPPFQAFRDAVAYFFDAFEVRAVEVSDVLVEQNRMAVCWRWTALHRSRYLDVEATHRVFSTVTTMWLTTRAGQITRDMSVWDAAEYLRLRDGSS